MGIAGLEPRQLAPTVGTTGAGSMGSPVPSMLQQIPSAHHCNSPNYTSNTRLDKQDVGLYPPGGRTWVNSCVPLFLSEAIKFAKRPRSLHELKALNMGIAGLEPRQLASTVGTTGAGSTGSPVPSTLQQIPSAHHCNSPSYTSNTRSDKQDVGLYPPGG
jgi:hypothetical protein